MDLKRKMIVVLSIIFIVILLGWIVITTRYQYNSTSGPGGVPMVTKIDRWTGEVYLLPMAGEKIGEWLKLTDFGKFE